ncbi:PseG/SpsG family protein [Bacillus amyloliquefaciens]|uniref:PseG/SpsG family protein n=1 Tax=Bacillus amyloliquefaciens TaxID=1390 RepID=UPI000DF163E2|nr:glycosyltransferase [Bacillus amyloliquefaciens]RCX33946.1 spore coat polysaccharide biosynthesis predicted glycosyltransferase SpsG [Bacillus amyloliquefaciens]
MRILIFADGGRDIGMGHAVRMKLLAGAIKNNCSITFYTNKEASSYLSSDQWEVIIKPDKGQKEFIVREINRQAPDLLIFDLLDMPCDWLEEVKKHSSARIVLFEEKREHVIHLCDAVINGIYGGLKSRTVQMGSAAVYEGPEYMILHPGFEKAKQLYQLRKECRTILVSLGGSDPKKLVFKVMEACRRIPDIHRKRVIIVMGGAAPHADDVRAHLTQMPYAEMVRQTNDMAALLSRADMAVVSGGITLYETICTGVPCIVLSQVEHQTETAEKFAARGAAVHLGLGECISADVLARHMSDMAADYPMRTGLHQNGKPLVDGRGIKRAAAILYDL